MTITGARFNRIVGATLLVCGGAYFAVLATVANLDASANRSQLRVDEWITFDAVRRILHPATLQLTVGSFERLYGTIPAETIETLRPLTRVKFETDLAFLRAATKSIGREAALRYRDDLLAQARHPYTGAMGLLYPLKSLLHWTLDGVDHRYGRILWNLSALFSAIPERLFGEQGQIVATRMLQAATLFAAYFILVVVHVKSWSLRALALLALITLPATTYYASVPKPEPIQLLCISLFFLRARGAAFCFGRHWFFLGLAFGAKISALPFVAVLILAAVWQRARALQSWQTGVKWFAGGWLVAVPVTVAAGIDGLGRYVLATFLSTGHLKDDPVIGWMSWARFVVERWTDTPAPWLIFMLTASAGVLGGLVVRRARRAEWEPQAAAGFLLLVLGTVSAASVAFSVKRLWEIYLHPGSMLILVGAVALAEAELRRPAVGHRVLRWATVAWLALGATTVAVFQLPGTTRRFLNVSQYSETESFQVMEQGRRQGARVLERMARDLRRPVVAMWDANFAFPPAPTIDFEIVDHWSDGDLWAQGFDFMALPRKPWVQPPATSALFVRQVRELVTRRAAHVSDRSDRLCDAGENCYVRVPTESPDVEFLVRADLMRP